MNRRPPAVLRWQAHWALRGTFKRKVLAGLLSEAGRHYAEPPALARTSTGRFNLRMAAYLLALRDALLEVGFPPQRAESLLAEQLYRVMRRFYRPTDALAFLVHPRDASARGRWRQSLSRRLYFRPPDWLMEEVDVPGAYAFDVKRCLMAEYMRGRGESSFCQAVICSQDLLMAAGRGERLARRETIAGGAGRCDFRFTGT